MKLFQNSKKKAPLVLPGGALLDFSRPRIMAIVNCTPDSFYPPSRAPSPEGAAERALAAEDAGADIIDFGAESTRPGSAHIDGDEELRRLIPALRLFRRQSSLPVSVDTRKAPVARMALDEGAQIINDISALEDDGDLPELCARRGAAVVLMHGAREARGARGAVPFRWEDLRVFLHRAVERALGSGIGRDKIILDPGIGFGKSTGDNLTVLARLEEIALEDYPLLIGCSRKRFIRELTGRPVEDALAGTLAVETAAILGGADIIRVHDTAPALDLVKIMAGLRQRAGEQP
ncbi:MAG: dihydropteroate synthase [Spirochaetaceae bacterium]|jgi:dihydropteroate synthase|nr:dihydropteroate synthase [Spirochaetaceae bacterium]